MGTVTEFEDRRPINERISEKIGDAVSKAGMTVFNNLARATGRDQINEKSKYRQDQKMQKQYEEQDMQEGKKMRKGGKVSSASKRADGCAVKGKTRGKIV